MTSPNSELHHAIEALNAPGIAIGHRAIRDGDESALLTDERDALARSVPKVRRASGAARDIARALLAGLGQPPRPIVKSPSGMPVWPDGVVGSLAHDAEIAVAAVACRRDFAGVGIDVEPAEPLDPALLAMIATAGEREQIGGDRVLARVLFCIKEAVYKAVYPLDHTFL
jgi:4'-phosphopantetheinyl transferase EntD